MDERGTIITFFFFCYTQLTRHGKFASTFELNVRVCVCVCEKPRHYTDSLTLYRLKLALKKYNQLIKK